VRTSDIILHQIQIILGDIGDSGQLED